MLLIILLIVLLLGIVSVVVFVLINKGDNMGDITNNLSNDNLEVTPGDDTNNDDETIEEDKLGKFQLPRMVLSCKDIMRKTTCLYLNLTNFLYELTCLHTLIRVPLRCSI